LAARIFEGFGLDLPKEPRVILPRFVLKSPLPIMCKLNNNVKNERQKYNKKWRLNK
jgi:hypothetical protein